MYAFVKYQVDGETAIVPTSFIKDFVEQENDPEKIYYVFWSPHVHETPEMVLETQGIILTEPEKERSPVPLAGYYAANVIMLGETEEELNLTLEKKDNRSKRVQRKIPKENIIQKKCQKSEKLKKKAILQGASKIQMSLFEEPAEKSDTAGFWKKKYLKVKSKLDVTEKINEQLTKANLVWQDRFLNFSNTQTNTSHITTKVSSKLFDSPLKSLDTNIPLAQMDNTVSSLTHTSTHQTSTPLSTLQEAPTPVTQDDRPIMQAPLPMEITEINLPANFSSNIQEETPIQECSVFQKAAFGVRPGKAGDSQFTKNLAVALFGSDVLSKSSVTGQRCLAKQNSEPKPALCTEKLSFLIDAFKKRARNEGSSEEEVYIRCKKINAYISDKIATLNRHKNTT